MPSTFVNVPDPVVPPFQGVPPLPLGGLGGPILTQSVGIGGGLSVGPGGAQLTPPQQLATQDDVGVFSAIGQNRWGIFGPGGASILTVDAVASIEYSKDFSISNYPQQKGSFRSYNKVENPFLAKVGFYVSKARATFLEQIEGWLKSLEFVTVATPEVQYPSANVLHVAYRRTSRHGVTMFLVEVWCEQVRVTASTDNSSTSARSINGQPTQNDGGLQPTEAQNPLGAGGGDSGGAGGSSGGAVFGSGSGVNRFFNGQSSTTNLESPNIGPAFYDGTNLPQVSDWGSQTLSQQQSMLNATANANSGLGSGAAGEVLWTLDGSGNSIATSDAILGTIQ